MRTRSPAVDIPHTSSPLLSEHLSGSYWVICLPYAFYHPVLAPLSLNDTHEPKGSLSSLQVSVSDPVASHQNQPGFHAIAELGKW